MKIELNIPGLLAVPPRLCDALPQPDASALRAWCRQARSEPIPAGRFGYLAHRLQTERAPLAQLAWLDVHRKLPPQQTFLATPVHFQPGLDDLVLFAGPALAVSADELDAIAHAVSAHFGDALSISASGNHLFLQTDAGLAVRTTPLQQAQGNRVRDKLPTGADAGRLHAWLNEIQMLLHGHEINRRRAERGAPTLNGLWIWGEGEWPAHPPRDEQLVVHANGPAWRGLALALGGRAEGAASSIHALSADGVHCLVNDECLLAIDADDLDGWRTAVERVSRDWLEPVMQRVRDRSVREAVLFGGDGHALQLSGRRSLVQFIAGLTSAPPLRFGSEC